MEKWLKLLGRLEGSSFLLLLLIAMPLKYWAAIPIGVKLMGPIHGALFLGYCALASTVAIDQNWSGKKHALAYLAAVLPLGTFFFERSMLSPSKKVA